MIVESLAVVTCLWLSAAEPATRPSSQDVKAQLRQAVLENVPAMKDQRDPWRLAVLLRDHVHHATTIGPEKAPIPLTVEGYQAIAAGRSNQLCYGISVLYHGLMAAFGMESRIVYLASRQTVTRRSGDHTHTAVEVKLGGQWVLQDPTFNVHWELDGRPLGALDLARAFADGKAPTPKMDGCLTAPGRSLGEYYIPYGDLLAYVEISELEVFGPQAGSYRTVKTFPPGPSWRYLTQESNRVPYRSCIWDILWYWDFSRGPASGWSIMPATRIATAKGGATIVKTDGSNSGYQLTSPVLDLPAGTYKVRVAGEILEGGMDMGVSDAGTECWIAQSYYRAGSDQPGGWDMDVGFVLTEERPVQVVMANWSLEGKPSKWDVRSVMLVQVIPHSPAASQPATAPASSPAIPTETEVPASAPAGLPVAGEGKEGSTR